MATLSDIRLHLSRLRNTGFDVKLSGEANARGFSPTFFFAIASRETNCVNELGDFQRDGAHGVGIVQIDIQHDIARQARDSGSWKTDPDPLIAFGAQMLADNISAVRHQFPALASDQQLKIAAAGYNCGLQRAIRAAGDGTDDCDVFTTQHDYGADVMGRKALFDLLLAPAV
jgi:hypothetical protein